VAVVAVLAVALGVASIWVSYSKRKKQLSPLSRHAQRHSHTLEQNWEGELQNRNGTLNQVTFSNHYSQLPLEDSSSVEEPALAPSDRQSMFDDPVYEGGFTASGGGYKPPLTEKRSNSSTERGMRSSLERSMKLIRTRVPSMRRTDSGSAENLLAPPPLEDSGDYDDVDATHPRPMTTPSINGDTVGAESSGMYANFAHHRAGAMGNAGERWQSYWENKTLIRTRTQESDPTEEK
jgi:hypothetical protein